MGIDLQQNKDAKTAKSFSVLAAIAALYSFLNLLTEILDEKNVSLIAAYIVNVLAFLAIDALIIAFVLYMMALIGKVSKERMLPLNISVGMTIVRVIVILVLFFTGHLFVIENGVYIERNLIFVPYAISCLVMVQLLWAIIKNRSSFSRKEFVVMLLYIILPIFATVFEVLTYIYSFTAVAITTSILLIYVLIQAVEIEKGHNRESTLKEITLTDLLTNLNNRRAYYLRINDIKSEEELGVIFCDINGLKYTNDHFGHVKGDELIQKFASLLTDTFRNEDIFRISGDEFVVLICNIPSGAFSNRVEKFKRILEDNNDIAALGSSYGAGSCFELLISEAEDDMYKEKKIVHERRPEYADMRKV